MESFPRVLRRVAITNYNRSWRLLGAVLFLSAICVGCKYGSGSENSGQNLTLTTFGVPHGLTASLLAETDSPPVMLYGPEVFQLRHEPTPREKRLLQSGRLLIADGGVDGFAKKEAAAFGAKSLSVVEYGGARSENPAEFHWLDCRELIADVDLLIEALAEAEPGSAESIRAMGALATKSLDAADKDAAEILKAYQGREVLIESPRLRPFLRRYGLKEAGTIRPVISRPATSEELDAFRQRATSASGAVLLITGLEDDRTIRDLAVELNLPVVALNPMLEGVNSVDDLVGDTIENARRVRLALETAKPSVK